jgi:AcrR family transcriptional regulator
MARVHKINTMKIAILQTATKLFFERGFSKTTAAAICKEMQIGTGNLTFYFPTKEHIFAALTEILCDFQWQLIEEATDEGKNSLLAYCMELAARSALCEENEQVHDLFVSSYQHTLTLEIMRMDGVKKIKRVFKDFCVGWSEEQLIEAASIISGIEYATVMTTKYSASLPIRIAGALESIMHIFGVPKDLRRVKIKKVLDMDYTALGRKILDDFKQFTEETNQKTLEELLNSVKRN